MVQLVRKLWVAPDIENVLEKKDNVAAVQLGGKLLVKTA